jgi:hypothetical protein
LIDGVGNHDVTSMVSQSRYIHTHHTYVCTIYVNYKCNALTIFIMNLCTGQMKFRVAALYMAASNVIALLYLQS